MDPELETIHWASIDSIYVEDSKYESFNAPKWVDLFAPDEPFNEEDWFCKPACKHPKTVEDFYKSNQNSKVKLLRSVSFSEILPFRERNRRVVSNSIPEESENKDPNVSTPISYKNPEELKSKSEKRPLKNPTLKSTFSTRNLLGGREIVSQITEFCSKLTRKGSNKQWPSSPEKTERRGILGELKERVRGRDKEREPLFNNGR